MPHPRFAPLGSFLFGDSTPSTPESSLRGLPTIVICLANATGALVAADAPIPLISGLVVVLSLFGSAHLLVVLSSARRAADSPGYAG